MNFEVVTSRNFCFSCGEKLVDTNKTSVFEFTTISDKPIYNFIESFVGIKFEKSLLTTNDASVCDSCYKKLEEYDRICQQAAKIQDEISNSFKKTQQKISESLSCLKLEVDDDAFDHELVFFEANDSDDDIKINSVEYHYFCSVCQEKFVKKKLYQSHIKFAHLPKDATIFNCADCADSLFISKLELQLHQNIFHSTDPSSKLFQCPACPKKFRTKALINRHFAIHTSSDRPFVCEQCGKSFFHYSSFQAHIKVHNDERAFSCKLCPKTFRSQSHLNRHTKTHTKQKSHECSECGSRFAERYNLTSHMKTHYGISRKKRTENDIF